MTGAGRITITIITAILFLLQGSVLVAQEQEESRRSRRQSRRAPIERPDPSSQRFTVEGGIMRQTGVTTASTPADSTAMAAMADSLKVMAADSLKVTAADSLKVMAADSLKVTAADGSSVAAITDTTGLPITDSLIVAPTHADPDSTIHAEIITTLADSLTLDSTMRAQMPRKELRKLERHERQVDSTLTRHYFFRDSIPISRLTAMSMVVPGLSQFYNKQQWKIPVLYGTVGAGIVFGIQQNKQYSNYKRQYDALIKVRPPTANWIAYDEWREQVDPIQEKMMRHNTSRQLLLGGALAAYVYFLGDGAVNYPGELTRVKKATTLSTICPGAGQMYNKSYWKVPVVVGGMATMAYMIDWNNRGYKRFKLAFDTVSETPSHETPNDEFQGRLSADQLRKYKDMYRRNRDLCIILTGAFYLLNIVDAHVDAHMKDYDISDNLAFTLNPSMTNIQLASTGTQTNLFGMSFGMTF